MTKEGVDKLLVGVRRDIDDTRIHAYMSTQVSSVLGHVC